MKAQLTSIYRQTAGLSVSVPVREELMILKQPYLGNVLKVLDLYTRIIVVLEKMYSCHKY